jgi:hypothetical protein
MADFTELPVYGGVGDWHFNRYRVVFKRPPALSKQLLAKDFVNNFPKYVTSKYAEVRKNRDFGSRPTIHFHGFKMMRFVFGGEGSPPEVVDQDVGSPHSDWVVKIDDNDQLGFTAQTLKREFRDLSEDGLTKVGGIMGALISPVLSYVAAGWDDPMEVNRMHFLAGRRSWRLDDGKNFEVDGDVLVVETCAVERFSHQSYVRADSVLGLQASIPDVWVAMLTNFVRMKALVLVPQRRRPGWENKEGIDYYAKTFDSFDALASDVEYAQQKRLGLFKTLLPASAPTPWRGGSASRWAWPAELSRSRSR